MALIGLGALTQRQIGYWRDSESLFTHTLAVTGPNWLAYNQLGGVLLAKNELDQAADALRRSLDAQSGQQPGERTIWG